MTSIVTWNIQNGEGCDGVTDLARIARVIRAMGEVDVICLQEVARNDPEYENGADQVARLARLFAGFEGRFGAALNRGGNRRYGNLVLSRLPILQSFNHLLPDPPAEKHMQRQATEIVVQTASGPLRVMTTHLEYYSVRSRAAQVARLRELQAEVEANQAAPAKPDSSPYDAIPRPASLVLCGDLNLLPDDAEYRALFASPFVDAWRHHRNEKHPSTTGLHDRKQWPTGGHCRNYFAVTADVAARIRSIEMDAATDASDHQPLRLVLS
jgi:endonuclease/exonuclease/phosphatase family metal-dependent hydrolase